MKMCIVTAHAGADCLDEAITSWTGEVQFPLLMGMNTNYFAINSKPPVFVLGGEAGMLPAYQSGFKACSSYDIIAYIHDDVILHDEFWHEKVLKEFEDPAVGVVGFGGALGHGDPRMYKTPYDYRQLARREFMSNMRDAEAHGQRFAGSRDCAVLDGFAVIVRREVLDKVGGWPIQTPIGYACYDYWLCCMARRLGYRIRVVGVACDHLGGQTFVKLGIGKDPKHWEQYVESHRYIYDEFKDVLPFEVF